MAAYFEAKDHNRPHLLNRAFTGSARLRMQVLTGTISFPPQTEGREAIGELLVRRFGQQYENVYSLCLGDPPPDTARHHACAWLVVMSDKASGEARIGCGRYDWAFDPSSRRASALDIRIDTMLVLPAGEAPALLAWAGSLPAPWCDAPTLLRGLPGLPALEPWRAALLAAGRECAAAAGLR